MALPAWLVLLDEWRVLVCTTCGHGVVPRGISWHLRQDKHRHLDRDVRASITRAVKQLKLPEPRQVRQPANGGAAIPELPTQAGYVCTWPACSEQHRATTSSKTAKAHQRQYHNGNNDNFRECLLQTFFGGQTDISYFVMAGNANNTDDNNDIGALVGNETPPAAPTPVPAEPSDWQQRVAERDEAQRRQMYARIVAPGHAAEADSWLRVTGFASHLLNLDKQAVQALHEPPAVARLEPATTEVLTFHVEQRILALACTVVALMKRLGPWATPEHAHQRTSHHDLELLNSYERQRIASRPFTVPINGTTIDAYVGEWARCCMYVARLVLLRQSGGNNSISTTTNSTTTTSSRVLAMRTAPTPALRDAVNDCIHSPHALSPLDANDQFAALRFCMVLVQ
jgi:hypothetical protein